MIVLNKMKILTVKVNEKSSKINILALILHRTLGDFAYNMLFASSVKEGLKNAELTVYFKPDRPYKSDIVSLCPGVDRVISSMSPLTSDLFDASGGAPPFILDGKEVDKVLGAGIVLTPHNLTL